MFKGSWVAIVTPFTKEGEVDEKSLQQLVEWHIQKGTDGIVCCGSTGEAPTLTEEEKLKIICICKETIQGRVKLIAGTGTYDTKKSVELTKKAKKIGVDGCLIIVPYYNRPTQEGCVVHFREIAGVGSPVIVYHHPGRTGVKLLPATFAKLEKIPNICAIKEASCEISFVKEIQKECSLPIFSGDDDLTVPMMQEGAVGVISVAANILPFEWKTLVQKCLDKKFDEAQLLRKKWSGLVHTLFLETNPQCVKYALSLMGKSKAFMRLPLLPPEDGTKEKIKKALKEAMLI